MPMQYTSRVSGKMWLLSFYTTIALLTIGWRFRYIWMYTLLPHGIQTHLQPARPSLALPLYQLYVPVYISSLVLSDLGRTFFRNHTMSFSFKKPTQRQRRQRSPSIVPSPNSPSGSPSTSLTDDPTIHHHLVPPTKIPRGRRPRHSQGQFIPGPRQILSVPGQSYVQRSSLSRGRPQLLQQSQASTIRNPELHDPIDDSHAPTSDFDFMTDVFISDQPDTEEMRQEKLRRKKGKQWARWTQEVIPSLLRPHLRLLHKSRSLCEVPRSFTYRCTCNASSSRSLAVVCVFFERMCDVSCSKLLLTSFPGLEIVRIDACQCSPAALQLISRGLFPCAPIAPTLAVDIKMLEFVRELFLRMPPNTTSWCETLEAFLGKRSYKLTTRVISITS